MINKILGAYIQLYTKTCPSCHPELVSGSYNHKIPKQVRNDIMSTFRAYPV